jgi:hypothetical protein
MLNFPTADQIYFDYLIRNGIATEIRGIEVLEAVKPLSSTGKE